MISRRSFWSVAALVLVVGGTWRVWIAAAVPCISRDGVNYCWFARDLGAVGVAALRADPEAQRPQYDQHPLYSLAMLFVERVLQVGGWDPSPMTWQRAGQVVAWLAGMAVIALCGLLARAVSRGLKSPASPRGCALCAMALAAVLPLNVSLSSEVMSDELHAALYLAGVLCLTRLNRPGGAFGAGLFGGLAFVTRPEGAVVALAGAAGLFVCPMRRRPAEIARLLTLVAVGFLLPAGPYWYASGRFSPKVDKQTIQEFESSMHDSGEAEETSPPRPRFAALVHEEMKWYASVPWTAYQVFRAGRVVVPVLAIAPLLVFVRRWRSRALFGAFFCMAAHFALINLLVVRHGYLTPRHALVIVLLLIPQAGLLLAYWQAHARDAGMSWLFWMTMAVCLVPLAWYAERVPNGEDAPLPRVADTLVVADADRQDKLLLGGAIERRIAFYADTRFQPWPENEPDAEQRYQELRRHLLGASGRWRPNYFAITTGEAGEMKANQALLDRLLADEQAGRLLRELCVERRGGNGAVYLYAVSWPAATP